MEISFQKGICNEQYLVQAGSTLPTDVTALILSLGNPQTYHLSNFWEFSNIFVNAVFGCGCHFEGIDVFFYKYNDLTIK